MRWVWVSSRQLVCPSPFNKIEPCTASAHAVQSSVLQPLSMMKYFLTIFLSLLAPNLWAADLSADIRKGASDPHAGDGNYLELSFSVGVINTPFYATAPDIEAGKYELSGSLDANVHYQYKGFFAEAFSQSLEQFTLGYNFADGEHWSLDLVALEQHEEVSEDINDDLKAVSYTHLTLPTILLV